MTGDAVFAIFPILTIFFYIAPVVFVIWFLFKLLKIQEERNAFLRDISKKLDKQTNKQQTSRLQIF
ncbi:hypothetical protein [Bacillus sp. 37MA]|uniref:hypothetical protein n=1 Tax=Bacillus sp. 37MA TaxID=1132442 RepID=UPI00036A7662|nr:hypothetical protein [Bacillus sp. 37MA]